MIDKIVVLHRNFNGNRTERYFINWSNAQVALDRDVYEQCSLLNGEIREKRVNVVSDVWQYEIYAYLPNVGGCGWWLTEEKLEDYVERR